MVQHVHTPGSELTHNALYPLSHLHYLPSRYQPYTLNTHRHPHPHLSGNLDGTG
jgi:hypothetical protein